MTTYSSDTQERPRRNRKSWSRALSLIACCILFAAAVGGAYWYGAHEQRLTFNDIPFVRDAITRVGTRVSQVETAVRNWDPQGFQDRLRKLEGSLDGKVHDARQAAADSVVVMAAQLRGEWAENNAHTDQRLSRLENETTGSTSRLAELEGAMSQMKGDLTGQQAQIQARLEEFERNAGTVNERLGDVRHDVTDGKREFKEFARRFDRQKIDFELAKNHNAELAPGISLCVTDTNTARRQVKGWVWIMPDRKTIWLSDQNAMQPVIFYTKADQGRREVVFTTVTDDSVVGYLLLPAADTPLTARVFPPH